MSWSESALVLRNHSPPEVWPVARGANVTVTLQAAPGTSVRPVVHPVATCQPAPVAGSTDTSVNVHGTLPQLVTVTLAALLLPTDWLPKSSASWLAQKRPCAASFDARSRKPNKRAMCFSGRSGRALPSRGAPHPLPEFGEYGAYLFDRPIDLFFPD